MRASAMGGVGRPEKEKRRGSRRSWKEKKGRKRAPALEGKRKRGKRRVERKRKGKSDPLPDLSDPAKKRQEVRSSCLGPGQSEGLALLKSAWTSEMEDPLYYVDLALILCNANAFKDGLLFLYEKLKLYKEVISSYKQAHDHEGLIACYKKLGDSSQGGDASLWGDLLKYFGELGEDCSKEVKEVLTYIEKEDVLPPIVMLQALSKNPCLTLSVVKDYIARKLEQESKLIEDDRKSIDKYQEETINEKGDRRPQDKRKGFSA